MKKMISNAFLLQLNYNINETDNWIIGVEKNNSGENLFDFYIEVQKNRLGFFKRLVKSIVFIFTGNFGYNQQYVVNSTTLQEFLNNAISCVNYAIKKEIKGNQKQRKIKISEYSKTIDEEEPKNFNQQIVNNGKKQLQQDLEEISQKERKRDKEVFKIHKKLMRQENIASMLSKYALLPNGSLDFVDRYLLEIKQAIKNGNVQQFIKNHQ